MPYSKKTIKCWVCEQPYTQQRPNQLIHRKCSDAVRKQRAAEVRGVVVPITAEKPFEAPFDEGGEGKKRLEEYVNAILDDDAKRPAPLITNISVTGYQEFLKIGVVPDTQCKPGVPLEHLYWAGRYLAEKRCDVIVHLGDHWDFPSLNSHVKGKELEGARFTDDLEAGNEGMRLFFAGLDEASAPGYNPRLVFLEGNHEERRKRLMKEDPKLEGALEAPDTSRWEFHPFLEVVEIAGIEFSHYFCSGAYNKAVSSPSALLKLRQQSAIQGHNQHWGMATHDRTHQTAIFAGAFYDHNESYLTPQGADHRRQLLILHEAHDGLFDLMQVSLEFLRRRYS